MGYIIFVKNLVTMALILCAALVVENNLATQVRDVFIAIAANLFGVLGALQAYMSRPDFSQALAAAKRVFKIIETPS